MNKKDILELNKKERRDDEGTTNFRGKSGWYARNFAYFTVFLLQYFSIAAGDHDVRMYLSLVLMSLCTGDLYGLYKATKSRSTLVFAILGALLCFYRLVRLGHSIGMS